MRARKPFSKAYIKWLKKQGAPKDLLKWVEDHSKPLKKRGDWSYWQGDIFIGYTWRHRLRLLIGLDGKIQNGQYVFKRVSYGSRLHRFLNYFLSYQPRKRRVYIQPVPTKEEKG